MIRQVGGSSLFVFLMVCASLLLHLADPGLIEYKGDEAYMHASVTASDGHSAFPRLGMPSGAAGLPNPGMSIWVFSAPAKLFGIESVEGLSRFVGMSFVIGAFLFFAYLLTTRSLSSIDRAAWLWGVGLSSVNPVLLLFTRKIWAQSLLPIFSMAIFVLWIEKKRHPLVRVALAFLCVLIGQIHMSGFFLGGALLAFELREVLLKRASLTPLLMGALLGVLPLLPWLSEIISPEGALHLRNAVGSASGDIPEIFKFRFWTYLLGFEHASGLRSSLGQNFATFARIPWVGASLAATLGLLIVAILGGIRKLRLSKLNPFDSPTASTEVLILGILGCGILMSLTGVRIHRHYLIVLTPLIGMGLARLYLVIFPRKGTLLLVAYTLFQLVLSVEMLRFIDKNRGAPDADFGVPYKYQMEHSKEPQP